MGEGKENERCYCHHYFDIDEEVVFAVCKKQLPLMLEVVKKMIEDLG